MWRRGGYRCRQSEPLAPCVSGFDRPLKMLNAQRCRSARRLLVFDPSHYLFAALGGSDVTSFSKRGSPRSALNIGSSRSKAGVSGTFSGSGPAQGIESSVCKAAVARSGSPIRAVTRARIAIGTAPMIASFSIWSVAMARSDRANAAPLSPSPAFVSARISMRL